MLILIDRMELNHDDIKDAGKTNMKELIDQLTRCPKVGGTYMVPDYLVSEIEQKFIAIQATVKKANEHVGVVDGVVNGEEK